MVLDSLKETKESFRTLILDFFNIIAKLKTIPRQGWIDKAGIKKPESVADHTFSMTAMAMVLSDLNELNTEKVLKMSLLHDLAESLTGDLTPDNISKDEKINLENKAMKEILDKLPEDLSINYKSLWEEFQNNNSVESKFLHDVDKLEMALQAKIYSQENFPKETLRLFLESAQNDIKSNNLKKILDKILAS